MEDVCHVDEPKTQELYHFAMNGKSFAVIAEHFPDMLQKVRRLPNESTVSPHSHTCVQSLQ